jgi:hypothetical protein
MMGEVQQICGRIRGLPPGIVSIQMQDLLMLAFTVLFFAVAFLYVKACQKLR